jgi:hypothetical protein
MKLAKLTLAIAGSLAASVTTSALAMDLYVDTKTKQIFAEPGHGRQKLGSYEKVDAPHHQPSAGSSTANIEELHQEISKEKLELQKMAQDLEADHNHMKALDEHIAAAKEANDKNAEKWFNKISMRGYTQLRWDQPLNGEVNHFSFIGDSGTAIDNKNFSLRRVRLIFQGDITDYLYLYFQPDFASSNGTTAQIRDMYADIHFDKKHEYRIRAGQSKVPFGWENMQSSQNRLTLDRSDPVNSAVASERELGLFAYWTPEHVQKLWKQLAKDGLKPSGDYGIVGFGVYNGQGINKAELNDDLYMVLHTTYPFELDGLGNMLGMGNLLKGQILEVGADAISGRYVPTAPTVTAAKNIYAYNGNTRDLDGNLDERVGVHAILFPKPFGLQTEWTWGQAGVFDPYLTPTTSGYERQSLQGGYVMAMYKMDKVLRSDDHVIPYVKWQTYDGVWRNNDYAPRINTDEVEAGIEWQIMKPLELTVAYATAERRRISSSGVRGDEPQYGGDMIRTQLQWNY